MYESNRTLIFTVFGAAALLKGSVHMTKKKIEYAIQNYNYNIINICSTEFIILRKFVGRNQTDRN